MNSTDDEFINLTKNKSSIWVEQQLIICMVSVFVGTFLFIITFIVPAVIIVRRIRHDKHQWNLRELRRMSDFM